MHSPGSRLRCDLPAGQCLYGARKPLRQGYLCTVREHLRSVRCRVRATCGPALQGLRAGVPALRPSMPRDGVARAAAGQAPGGLGWRAALYHDGQSSGLSNGNVVVIQAGSPVVGKKSEAASQSCGSRDDNAIASSLASQLTGRTSSHQLARHQFIGLACRPLSLDRPPCQTLPAPRRLP